MTNSNLKFKTIVKDRLFYNRYRYCISFELDEVSCLRELNHGYIDRMIERRRVWREVSLQKWINNSVGLKSSKNILTRRFKDITEDTVKNLHDIADILLETQSDFKLVTSASFGWIYSNNYELMQRLNQESCLEYKGLSQAVINRPANTIKLKNPQHQHRGYFKTLKLTNTQKHALASFLKNQADTIRLSPSLDTWLTVPLNRTQDYFFIDYNENSWATMLSLVHPGLLRKTVDLIAA